jgi:uncharacterized protein
MTSAKADTTQWLRPELVASYWEIGAVLFLTIGYFAYGSAQLGLYRASGHRVDLRESNYGGIHLTAVQSATLTLFLLFLCWRGWTPSDFKIQVGWWSTAQTLPLLIVDLVVTITGVFLIYRWRFYHFTHVSSGTLLHPHVTHLNWVVLISHQVINATFEEVVCMCYTFNQFAAKRGPLVALVLMLLLRISYHTWKTPAYLCLTVVGFSIYGLWYWKFRNVWPLILAHAGIDLFLLYPQVR